MPAEIGHAPYARPLLSWLASRFSGVHVVAIREKVFRDLSEDVWLLFADGFGDSTGTLEFSAVDRFDADSVPPNGIRISLEEWRNWRCRLRPLLLPERVRTEYRRLLGRATTRTLGDFARVGIGYVSGDNAFFHLRPSKAKDLGIPDSFLSPTVRRGSDLKNGAITTETVSEWRRADAPNFLLRLDARSRQSSGVRQHLESEAGQQARRRYKCRVRNPWYSVPNVPAPDLFLSYMSSSVPALVENRAGCTCTNAVHAVHLRTGASREAVRRGWRSAMTALSCEIEGHPLGGGVLKLEPREALRVAITSETLDPSTLRTLREGTDTMRVWRHRG